MQNPLLLSSPEDPASSTHIFNRYLYQPVVDTVEWASFLLLKRDMERVYEKHLINQIQKVYSITESLLPELLQNDDYENLKKIINEWKNESQKLNKIFIDI